jgi:GH35 family endo-1,4-beta-xylanase
MNRRKFVNNLLYSTAMVSSPFLLSCKGKRPTEGEEWRIIEDYNSDTQLRPYDTVINEAKENIRKNKMQDIVLILKNHNTNLNDKPIQLIQQSHDTILGMSHIQTASSFETPDQHNNYQKAFSSLFNCTTAKCYWDERWHQPIESEEGKRIYKKFLAERDSALDMGIKVKGHPLFWTVPKAFPDWLMKYSYSDQLKIIENHVKDLVTRGGKGVHFWDAVNEMLWEPTIKNIAQRNWPHLEPEKEIADYVAKVLTWAREVDSQKVYSLNEYGLVKNFTKVISAHDQRKRYLNLIEELRKTGVLPDAIGIQSHIGKWFHPDEIKITLDHLGEAGLPLQITEFWAHNKDYQKYSKEIDKEEMEELQSEYINMFYTMAFSHEKVNHITYWGNPFFNDGDKPTLAYKNLDKLINKEWKTKTEKSVNENGEVSFKGFTGVYDLLIDGQKASSFSVSKESGEKKIEVFC